MKKAFDKVSHLLKEKFRNKKKEDGASRQVPLLTRTGSMTRSQPNPLEPSRRSYSAYAASSSSAASGDDMITRIVADFDQETGKFDGQVFKIVIGTRYRFDLVTRKDALDFKERKEAEWLMLQDMTKLSGNKSFRCKLQNDPKIEEHIKIVCLCIGSKECGACVLVDRVDQLKANVARKTNSIGLMNHVMALGGFEREHCPTFLDRVENDVKPQIYIICCSFDGNVEFEEVKKILGDFSAWEGSKDKLVVIGSSSGMDQIQSQYGSGMPIERYMYQPPGQNEAVDFAGRRLNHEDKILVSQLVMVDTISRAYGWIDPVYTSLIDEKRRNQGSESLIWWRR